ncbi:pantothenate kinase [Bradyrhizobium sp. AZCC 1719]
MDIRTPEQQYNPYRIFTREQWARLRDDTPDDAGAGRIRAVAFDA